MIKVLTQES